MKFTFASSAHAVAIKYVKKLNMCEYLICVKIQENQDCKKEKYKSA